MREGRGSYRILWRITELEVRAGLHKVLITVLAAWCFSVYSPNLAPAFALDILHSHAANGIAILRHPSECIVAIATRSVSLG